MATLTQWVLPLNAPNPYPFYLQHLTPVLQGRLYYTKYILGIIGELNVRTNLDNVREWVIPPAILGGVPYSSPDGIVYYAFPRRRAEVWFAVENANRLVYLDPRTGTFTAFGGSQYPIRSPRHLMFDRTKRVKLLRNLWYTGSGTNGALIGRLNIASRRATYWDLPIDLLTPEGIWVESGVAVWFTPINTNSFLTGAFLARLEPSTDQLTYWTCPPPGKRPVNAGVVGDRPVEPTNIWFTYDGTSSSQSASRVFRLHTPSGPSSNTRRNRFRRPERSWSMTTAMPGSAIGAER